jgi:PQQ-dependent catabolism-associated CXXCW motif protein
VRSALFLLVFLAATSAFGQIVGLKPPPVPPVDEAQDFGVASSAELRLVDHASPTPREIPGARTISTGELRKLLQTPPDKRPLLFDAIGDEHHASLPGAIALPGVGSGASFDDEIQGRLAKTLLAATAGDRARTLIFFCTGPHCWLSYNAALRAARLGYPDVRWYRGGIEAWGAGGGALNAMRAVWKR